ncbi:MAG TPA: serine protease [Rhodothermales bacterium]|nr:serine protease [Rhodothermales bacterium]
MRRLTIAICIMTAVTSNLSSTQIVTNNVLTRVFQIRYAGQLGTAFTLDVDNRQYLITARHVVENIGAEGEIELRREEGWHKIKVRSIEVKPAKVDIAVLAPSVVVSPSLPLAAGMDGLYVSQQVAFVGFPYGMISGASGVNLGYPIAFVKHGVCAAFDVHDRDAPSLWVDAHNNRGFSGGPVVFTNKATNGLTVAGVVSGFRHEEEPVFENGKKTKATIRENTGLLFAYSIDAAVRAIKANPIGVQIEEPHSQAAAADPGP